MTDFKTVSPRATPNEALMCPRGFCPNHNSYSISPTYNADKISLKAAWDKMIQVQPRVQKIAEDTAADKITYVQRSFLFRFPDVVTVQFIGLDDKKSTLAMHSYSIYGAGDLGVNGNRIKTWVEDLSNRLNP